MVEQLDSMAIIKAVLPSESVFSGLAPLKRREEIVSSDALMAADIKGVLPFLVFGCKEIGDDDDDDNGVAKDYCINVLSIIDHKHYTPIMPKHANDDDVEDFS